ncbi:hypothetical protein SAMD00019534_008570 [Acytostelium subglobosum LB1]|uniref:hypothetical protein n=1 Tax=Acytostelium subglobosum LB1 TaxID=1410327 RepID=UPI000644D7D0|nr:hypothetical protein SAMD00019534_008570 [Acytostelium subglobosum LB1]GAM17682.1 hypothetical protein SAMD00019534_008570 [Acytostelium subglobosum LB1]|eukprot:XP_012758278.1 hypothetical protein SAMD00019534_008570 [Acytostelium subglobosum LB1]
MSTSDQTLTDPLAVGPHGQTYMHYAAEAGHVTILRLLTTTRSSGCKLNVNALDNDGLTPLHWACLEGKHLAVQYLLESAGATVNPPDNNGETPLYLACLKGSLPCVNQLIKHSASINQQTKSGNTSLHIAIINNNLECIERLLQCEADINLKNNAGKTPMMVVAEESKPRLRHRLLNRQDNNNWIMNNV